MSNHNVLEVKTGDGFLPRSVMRMKEIKWSAKIVLAHLLGREGWDFGVDGKWPSTKTLAFETGMSERTVRNSILALRKAGLVSQEEGK